MVVGVGLIMSGFLGGVQMHVEHGFGPVWNAESRVLVLGSLPSPKSCEMNFYHGHPRNRFWPVMAAVFHDDSCLCENTDPIQTVRTRKGFALRHHMALWDVIASCDIEGASDASIHNAVPNDFSDMLRQSQISHIFTTGAKAAQLYQRLCIPLLQTHGSDNVPMTRLLSTSPTNVGTKLPELVEAYSCVGRVASGKAVMQPE